MATPSRRGAPIRVRSRACAWVSAAALLLGCAEASRYVVVDDAVRPGEQETSERRLVSLSAGDARANAGLLGLRTRSSVQKYGEERNGSQGPTEAVLFHLVSGQYATADAMLRAHGAEIPEYLRRLLAADLASEGTSATSSPPELLKLYQEAYDAQKNDKARRIVELRVRQLRYGR